MGHKRLRSDGHRQHGCSKCLERRIVSDVEMLSFKGVERKYVAMRTVGRPRSAVTAAEARDLERHKIAVELTSPDRHESAAARAFSKLTRVGGNVENQPMSERARELEFRRQIGIRYADRKAFRSCRHAGPHEPRRDLVFFSKALRDERSGRYVRRTEGEWFIPLRLGVQRCFDCGWKWATIFLAPFARLPGTFVRSFLVRLARQRGTRPPSEHRIENDMAVEGRVKLRRHRAIAEYKHASAEIEKLFNFTGKKDHCLSFGSEVPQVPVQIKFRTYVDPARRIIQH